MTKKGTTTYATSSDKIFINEFLPNPNQGNEWIEVYNEDSKQINLQGWSLHDGVGKITTLDDTIPSSSFITHNLDTPKLNNGGDTILLKNKNNELKDKISYGDWNSQGQTNNIAKPRPGNSLARKDASGNFFETTKTTKGSENIINEPTEDKQESEDDQEKEQNNNTNKNTKQQDRQQAETYNSRNYNKSDVVINEVMSSPKKGSEYVELYNNTTEKIELQGWQLVDGSENEKNLSGKIPPKKYFLQNYGSSLLNNRGDLIKLISPKRKTIDKLIYGSRETEEENLAPAPEEGEVLARIPDGKDTDIYDKDFSVISSTKGTTNPKVKDEIDNNDKAKEKQPKPTITGPKTIAKGEQAIFEVQLPSGWKLKTLVWRINTNKINSGTTTLKHRFKQTGKYEITAWIIRTNGKAANATTQLKVKKKQNFTGGFIPTSKPSKIIISEILPNPKGSDKKEFIELFNPTTKPINLGGFKLDDEADSSDKYELEDGTMIKPKSYAVFPRKETNIALNNSGDQVRILNPDNEAVSTMEYQQAKQGASFDGKTWSKIQTPGFKNEILAVNQPQKSTQTNNNKAGYNRIPLNKTSKLKEGKKITTRGIVSVRPNVLGNRIFYIQGSPGLQVYNHKGKFPEIKLGDKLEVRGEISRAYGKIRLKTEDKFSIRKISHPGQPKPKQIQAEELNQDVLARLVQVHGRVTEVGSDVLYLSDQTDEVEIEIEENIDIDPDRFKQKDLLRVTGIVTTRGGEYSIKPRSRNDLEKTGTAKTNQNKSQSNNNLKNENKLEKYIIATAGAIIIILLTLLLKEKRKS
ncbi:MAG: lamin tail domain-containing protein [Candidatus Paceibacteria bacterium]